MKELQRRALEYVKESLFSGESHPDATRRKFRPNRQKIRNLVSSVRNELRFSKTDQEICNVSRKNGENGEIFIFN